MGFEVADGLEHPTKPMANDKTRNSEIRNLPAWRLSFAGGGSYVRSDDQPSHERLEAASAEPQSSMHNAGG